ncbi:hypothetical protein TruAng_009911 [Truncatella angustata]|nr:hypothetical protein TruAng_009911 [Truncatella angustata]
MLPLLLRSLPQLGRTWNPLTFSNPNFVQLPSHQKVEEEAMQTMLPPGTILLGLENSSKIGIKSQGNWGLEPARLCRRHVTLKLFINSASMGKQVDNELNMYKRIDKGSKNHPGRSAVRSLLDFFDVDGPEGQHRCLVHPPLWESVLTFLHRNPPWTFCIRTAKIIHADIKGDNIMFGIGDNSVFSDFEEQELQKPCPRKEVDGRTIYVSRELRMPKEWGAPVLCDFISAMPGDMEHLEDIQPNIYRAPEVILEAPWTYSVDVWNVGCMIWDIFEGGHLFKGHDPEHVTYRSRAHLAEMITLLGPPPRSLLARANLSHNFFSDEEFELHEADMKAVCILKRILLRNEERALDTPIHKNINIELESGASTSPTIWQKLQLILE